MSLSFASMTRNKCGIKLDGKSCTYIVANKNTALKQ